MEREKGEYLNVLRLFLFTGTFRFWTVAMDKTFWRRRKVRKRKQEYQHPTGKLHFRRKEGSPHLL